MTQILRVLVIELRSHLPSHYYNNRVDVRGHKYVFGPTQTHFSPSAARVKMSLRRAKNIFMPKNINCITIIINLKGNIRHKNIKIDCKLSNSRLSASCIYFVVLFEQTVYLRSKKNENHFQNTKRRMKNNSLQITSDSWHEKSKFRL